MDLINYSDEELLNELERRKNKPRVPTPIDLKDVDWGEVYDDAVTHIEQMGTEDEEHDDKQYIYEDVMRAIYSDTIWEYINKVRLVS